MFFKYVGVCDSNKTDVRVILKDLRYFSKSFHENLFVESNSWNAICFCPHFSSFPSFILMKFLLTVSEKLIQSLLLHCVGFILFFNKDEGWLWFFKLVSCPMPTWQRNIPSRSHWTFVENESESTAANPLHRWDTYKEGTQISNPDSRWQYVYPTNWAFPMFQMPLKLFKGENGEIYLGVFLIKLSKDIIKINTLLRINKN